MAYKNILVGIDGSKRAERAFETAVDLAKIYLKKAQDKGADASATVIIGSIKTVLAYDFPDQHDIDLIVLGSTGINAVEKMLQGSHTDYVVRHAKADVLVVK